MSLIFFSSTNQYVILVFEKERVKLSGYTQLERLICVLKKFN